MAIGIVKKKKSFSRRFFNQVRRGTGFSLTPVAKKILGKRPYAEVENETKRRRTMAYRRRSSKRSSRRFTKRRSAFKKKRTTGLVKRVKLLEHGTEVKHKIFTDQGVAGGTAFFAGANLYGANSLLVHLNGLTRGDTVQDREGDKVTVTRIQLKIIVYLGTGIVNQTYIKYVLFTCLGHQSSLPTPSTIMSDWYGTTQWSPALLNNLNNRDNTQKYHILKTGVLHHVAPTDASIEQEIININYFKPINCSYTRGNTGGITDIDKNSIFVMLMTDTAVTVNGIHAYGEGHIFYRG